MTPDLPWMAGVFDARGFITTTNRHGYLQPRVTITTRRRDLLDTLAAMTGTKVVSDDKGYHRKMCGEHCADQHVEVVRQSAKWMADSLRATVVLHNLLPYMRTQRSEAQYVLECGLERYPAARGDTAKQMVKLGWALPPLAVHA